MCWGLSKQKITQAFEIITNGCLKPLGWRVFQRSELEIGFRKFLKKSICLKSSNCRQPLKCWRNLEYCSRCRGMFKTAPEPSRCFRNLRDYSVWDVFEFAWILKAGCFCFIFLEFLMPGIPNRFFQSSTSPPAVTWLTVCRWLHIPVHVLFAVSLASENLFPGLPKDVRWRVAH